DETNSMRQTRSDILVGRNARPVSDRVYDTRLTITARRTNRDLNVSASHGAGIGGTCASSPTAPRPGDGPRPGLRTHLGSVVGGRVAVDQGAGRQRERLVVAERRRGTRPVRQQLGHGEVPVRHGLTASVP